MQSEGAVVIFGGEVDDVRGADEVKFNTIWIYQFIHAEMLQHNDYR